MRKIFNFIRNIKIINTQKTGLVKDVFDSVKKILIVIIVGLIIMKVISLSQRGIEDKRLSSGNFMIKPSSLFQTEELKILEPHLNMQTGAAEIRYKGNKQYIRTKYEIWEKDELKTSKNLLGIDILDKDRIKGEYNEIISVSLKNKAGLKEGKTTVKTILTAGIGGLSASAIIEDYPLESGYNFTSNRPMEAVIIEETEEIIIWELRGNRDNEIYEDSSKKIIEEDIKPADWKLVLKVYLK